MSRFLAGQSDPAAVEAALSAEVVTRALLLELQFKSGTVRLSNALMPITTADGNIWHGLGDLVGMSDIEGGPDNLAPLREYYLGIPWEFLTDDSEPTQAGAKIPALIGNPSDYRGQAANLLVQHFSGDVYDRSGMPALIGTPVSLDPALMTNVSWRFAPGDGGVVLTLRVESALARKGAPQYGLLTDRDQKRRYGDDQGLRFVTEVMSTNPKWTNW